MRLGPVRSALRRVGIESTSLAPGAVLLQRRPRGARTGKYRVVRLGQRSVVVTPKRLPRSPEYSRDKATWNWLFDNHLRHVLRTYDVDTVVDVGANTGQYARQLRRIGFRGRILSFEPVPDVFCDLERAAADDEQWTVHQIALGREHGTLTMNVVPGTCSSALPASDYGRERFAELGGGTTVDVPLRRLDAVLPELLPGGDEPRRIYLKLDTQGFDLEAFAGAKGCLDEVVAMQSEMALVTIYDGMPRMPEALTTYEAAGFEVSGMVPISYDHTAVRVLEYDCVLVRAAGLPPAASEPIP